MLYNIKPLHLHCVFHGIRFKVNKDWVSGIDTLLFYIPLLPRAWHTSNRKTPFYSSVYKATSAEKNEALLVFLPLVSYICKIQYKPSICLS